MSLTQRPSNTKRNIRPISLGGSREGERAPAGLLRLLPRAGLVDVLGRAPEGRVPPPLVHAGLEHEARAVRVRGQVREVVALRPRGQRLRADAVHRDACGRDVTRYVIRIMLVRHDVTSQHLDVPFICGRT